MENWVIQELESLDVGDVRLEKRVKHVLSVLSRSPKESIPVSCRTCRTWSETKAAYRCFSSDKISADKIMAPHKQQTIKRVQNFKRFFVLQDTTELNYSAQKEKQGVGPKKHKDKRRLLLHPQLVISDSGVCLGVGRDADLLIMYALPFGCGTWQRLMWFALSAMKSEVFDVMVIRHQEPKRYCCKLYLKTFQLHFHYNGARQDIHQGIVDMAMNGSGCRDTAQVLGINLNTVLQHLKKSRQNTLPTV